MLRRRLEPPPTDRPAVILGMPPVASAAGAPPLGGWVPQRSSFTRMEVPPPTPGGALIGPVSAGSARPTPAQGISSRGRHRRAVPPKPTILTVPTALRGLRRRPRRLGVLGVLILLTSALVLGVRVALARSSAQPKPIAAAAHGPPVGLVTRTVPAAFATKGVSGSTPAAGAPAGPRNGPGTSSGGRSTGPGSRVLDAVQAAGGPSPSADLNQHRCLTRQRRNRQGFLPWFLDFGIFAVLGQVRSGSARSGPWFRVCADSRVEQDAGLLAHRPGVVSRLQGRTRPGSDCQLGAIA